MSEKHTPGPWVANRSRVHTSDDNREIAVATKADPLVRHAATANARLIAAAPELLEALQAMVDRWEPDCGGQDRVMWENACAAIAKATGNE